MISNTHNLISSHEYRAFPVQLQLHLGAEIKSLEETIKMMEQ